MIRLATHADIPELVRMAGDFIAGTDTGLQFDHDYLESSFAALIAAPDKLVLVLDLDGACGVFCAASGRSPWGRMAVASELLFWIDLPQRGLWAKPMMRAYCDWARGMGCARAGMVALADHPLDRLYEKAGFRRSEITYSQVL